MRSSLFLPILFSALELVSFATGNYIRLPNRDECDVSHAYSILEHLPTGSSFCSSLLYPYGRPTITKSTTTTVSGTDCTVKTKTETTKTTITKTVYGATTTLPVITKTEYSTTVLIPSGVEPSINKRMATTTTTYHATTTSTTTTTTTTTYHAATTSTTTTTTTTTTNHATTTSTSTATTSTSSTTTANNHATTTTQTTTTTAKTTTNATPTGLSTCYSQTISSACRSLVPPTDTTTLTSTHTKPCTTKSTTTITKTKTDRATTVTIPFLVSPPPIIISTTATLTTTVPAACANTPYNPSGDGVGSIVLPIAYPVFAQTGVECCVACFQTLNCVASAFIESGLDCQLLIQVNATGVSATDMCPLGLQDYPFGTPEADGDVYPGPCGY